MMTFLLGDCKEYVNITACDHRGKNARCLAAEAGQLDIIKYLVNKFTTSHGNVMSSSEGVLPVQQEEEEEIYLI